MFRIIQKEVTDFFLLRLAIPSTFTVSYLHEQNVPPPPTADISLF
jgi:hypothetical protein